MPVRLTETAIRAAIARAGQTGRRDLADAALPGLRLRLTPAGAASWALACRDPHGRMRRFQMGAFPAMGLSEARDKARALRVRVREGEDPVAERRRARAIGRDARDGIGTLAALLELYAAGPGAELKTWREAARRVAVVFAPHLRRPLASLTAGELQMTADGYPARQSAAAAVRYLRPVLKWGAKRGHLPKGVGEVLEQPQGAIGKRARRLSRQEIAAVLTAASGVGAYGAAIRLLFLTAARLNEVCGMRWRDLDLDAARWTLARTKTGAPHAVPLPRQAVALLRALQPEEASPEALVLATRGGKALNNWDRAAKALHEASGTAGWHRHDIRRTVASLAGDLGVAPHVVEAMLGHVLGTGGDGSRLGGAAAIYNRSRYEREHAEALQLLADELELIERGAANVVRFGMRA
jgi:integrase